MYRPIDITSRINFCVTGKMFDAFLLIKSHVFVTVNSV